MKGHQHNEKYKVGLCGSCGAHYFSVLIPLTLSNIRVRKLLIFHIPSNN